MFTKITSNLQSRILDRFSWRSPRKLLLIESDDWGSIRMPSRRVYERLLKKGFDIENDPYWKYDALESETDLNELFHVLSYVQDKHGHPARFTANCLMANPDFERIRENGFQQYVAQPVARTFAEYPEHARSMQLWKQGARERIFQPQFHGREHVHTGRWMQSLQADRERSRMAFDAGTFSIGRADVQGTLRSYMHALEADTPDQAREFHQNIRQGLELFEQTLGFRPGSFIAPCYHWSRDLEKTLHQGGVHTIQGNRYQFEPRMLPAAAPLRRVHYTGKINDNGQVYLVRNCFFEPGAYPRDWVGDCLGQIRQCFRRGKPAIISSHRMNYIGFIHPEHRERNLRALEKLLGGIVRQWPEVEFLSSDELGNLIAKN